MKITWSAALLVAASGFTYAQSSVTLYGIVDTGLSYYNHATSHGGSEVGVPTLTGEVPSRWGLKGIEDLGGGYKTFFVLESGFQPGTGLLNYGGRLFGRQANVGVSSDYGSLTLGRQMNMTMYALTNADVIGPSIHSIASFDPYLPNSRSDNAVGYLEKFRGVTLGGTTALVVTRPVLRARRRPTAEDRCRATSLRAGNTPRCLPMIQRASVWQHPTT